MPAGPLGFKWASGHLKQRARIHVPLCTTSHPDASEIHTRLQDDLMCRTFYTPPPGCSLGKQASLTISSSLHSALAGSPSFPSGTEADQARQAQIVRLPTR